MAEPRERPILFSGPMVRAILDGRKTQTRRIMKPQPGPDFARELRELFLSSRWDERQPCPYGKPGDRLWVRETFWVEHDDDFDEMAGRVIDCGVNLKEDDNARVQYLATPENPERPDEPGTWWEAPPDDWDGESDYRGRGTMTWLPWGTLGAGPAFFSKRPAIHMPRWASRLTLVVVNVRVERLHDITEEDAKAEGVERHPEPFTSGYRNYEPSPSYESVAYHPTARESFASLWRSINGAESWTANPWVWVVEFRRVEAPTCAAQPKLGPPDNDLGDVRFGDEAFREPLEGVR